MLYDFLKKQFITNKLRRQGLEMPENLAHFVMRKVWLMTHIYANPKQKTHKKITFARHGVDPILVLNKILDYITNGLSASSLTVGEDKKLEGVRQLDERGDFAWMLPILPALLRELKQYVQIDDGYIQEVKTVVGELAQKQSTTPYTTLLTHLLSLDPQ